MPRFFVKKDQIDGGAIRIIGDDAYHIARSLRMAVGDSLTVSNGEGVDYLCRLERIRDEECVLCVLESYPSVTESPVRITLYMAYPKGDKLETVIQKAVELGADRIVPFESSRCIKRPKADKLDKQLARLTRIAEEAAKQCGRSRLPEVSAPLGFSAMLAEAVKTDAALFCYEAEDGRTLKDALSGDLGSLSVIVGCEGGFSQEEAKSASDAGCITVSLGKRILRCETAPAFVLSSVAYQFEL